MKSYLFHLFCIVLMLVLSACGEEGEESDTAVKVAQGLHFQGRDCMGCHNVNLDTSRALLVAGTVYKSSTMPASKEDMSLVCGGNIGIELWDSGYTTLLYRSKDYVDPNSKGNLGKGNIFILKRMLGAIVNNNYGIKIVDANGVVLATVNHILNGQAYDPKNPIDYNNRISCNACHSNTRSPIYVDVAKVAYCQ